VSLQPVNSEDNAEPRNQLRGGDSRAGGQQTSKQRSCQGFAGCGFAGCRWISKFAGRSQTETTRWFG